MCKLKWRGVIISVLFFFFVSSGFSYSAEYNLIRNSSFEIDKNKDGIPDGFSVIVGDGRIDTEIFHSGKKSWRFTHKKRGGSLIIGGTSPSIKGDVFYTVSAYVKTKDLKGRCYLSILEYSKGIPTRDEQSKIVSYSSKFVRGTTDWQRISITFKTNPKTDFFQVRCNSYADKGTVWWDDIQVEEGDKATEYTDKFISSYYRTSKHIRWGPMYHEFVPSMEIETPHIKWCKPYIEGDINLFF